MLRKANMSLVVGTSSWREQFIEAVTVSAGRLKTKFHYAVWSQTGSKLTLGAILIVFARWRQSLKNGRPLRWDTCRQLLFCCGSFISLHLFDSGNNGQARTARTMNSRWIINKHAEIRSTHIHICYPSKTRPNTEID